MEIAIIGPGTMGLMIARRFVDRGFARAEEIRLSRVRPGRRQVIEQVLPGARILTDNREAVVDAELIILAVKPATFSKVADELRKRIQDDALVISIMTGVDLATIRENLGVSNIARASTNIGIETGVATTYWITGAGISSETREQAVAIFQGWGDEIECADEILLDIAIVGVGSGPALVIEFVQALTRAMVTEGMPHDLAERGILSLLRGTLELRMTARDRALSQFQQEVVTPGGITAEALLALEEGRFRATIINAFRKAHQKVHRLAQR